MQSLCSATFRVGRHHHRGPLCEGRGLTHALTHTALTDLTVAAALVRKPGRLTPSKEKRRRSRLWPKPVNLRTWGLVPDPIVMVQVFAELRYGVVAHTRENSVKYGLNFNQTPYIVDGRAFYRRAMRHRDTCVTLYGAILLCALARGVCRHSVGTRQSLRAAHAG